MQILLNNREVLTMQDAAKLANISIRWLEKLAGAGRLETVKHEKRRFVYRESLEKYMEEKSYL